MEYSEVMSIAKLFFRIFSMKLNYLVQHIIVRQG